MHDALWALVQEVRQFTGLFRELIQLLRHHFKSNIIGGRIRRIGDITMGTVPTPLPPLQPGVTAKFQVTPEFSGAVFTLDPTRAAVTSSDTTNFPVTLDPTDPQGTTIIAAIPTTAVPVGGSESITVTWTYTNLDGKVATVTGTVTEEGITDDVTGGTFARIA